MCYQELNAFIVIRECREKVLALLVYGNDGTLRPLVRGFLDCIGKTRSLERVQHQDYAVKILIWNK